jgi:hypothetical protein
VSSPAPLTTAESHGKRPGSGLLYPCHPKYVSIRLPGLGKTHADAPRARLAQNQGPSPQLLIDCDAQERMCNWTWKGTGLQSSDFRSGQAGTMANVRDELLDVRPMENIGYGR